MFDHERQRQKARPGAVGGATTAPVPGKSTRVAALIQRAQASPATALPAALRARFEQSTGADLGGVRVHTGAESAEAAAAVDARAFAIGSDLHFAAGEFAPGSAAGDHLIAHEAFHALQAPAGAAPATDDELTVSHGSDPAELDADRAADAMITGAPAAAPSPASGAVVHRKAGTDTPKNSYNRGGALVWSGGAELTAEEMTSYTSSRAALLGQVGGWVASAAGLQVVDTRSLADRMAERDDETFERDCALMQQAIDHCEREIEALSGDPARARLLAMNEQRKAEEESRLAARKERHTNRVDLAIKATENIRGYASEGMSAGLQTMQITGDLSAEQFAGIEDLTGKLGKALKFASLGARFCDAGALRRFQADPSFESAAAWGAQIGSILDATAGLASGLPPGFDDVIGGSLKTAGVVIANFTSLVRTRYAKIDRMTRGDACQKSELLRPGETGCSK
jgi:hypothetical protein